MNKERPFYKYLYGPWSYCGAGESSSISRPEIIVLPTRLGSSINFQLSDDPYCRVLFRLGDCN